MTTPVERAEREVLKAANAFATKWRNAGGKEIDEEGEAIAIAVERLRNERARATRAANAAKRKR